MIRFRFWATVGLGLGLLNISLGATLRQASANEILVPANANPCCPDGQTMWSSLITIARRGVPLHVILNPASGPGAGPEIDPNYVNAFPSIADPLLDLYLAGAKIYGYVATDFGNRDINDAKSDIDLYYDSAFYLNTGIELDGIFLDEMSNDLADVGYYELIRQHILGLDATARIFGNPGTSSVNDSSGGTSGSDVTDYADSVDTMITFENTGEEYQTNYTAPSWQVGGDADWFGHIVHTVPSRHDVFPNIKRARHRGARFLYMTDDILPNPFDRLPSYWKTFLLGVLDAKIRDLDTRRYVKWILRWRLYGAKRVLDDGNDANDVRAVRSLTSFVHLVEYWAGSKILNDDASDLVARAEAITDLIEEL